MSYALTKWIFQGTRAMFFFLFFGQIREQSGNIYGRPRLKNNLVTFSIFV